MKKTKGKKVSVAKNERSFSDIKDLLARALADYDNLQKRVEKERSIYRELVKVEVFSKILPILDMLEEAQSHLKDSGLAITINSFEDLLKSEGVERIKAQAGSKFDERVHEATEAEQADGKAKAGEIIEEILPGYTINNVLIRPAKVKVARA